MKLNIYIVALLLCLIPFAYLVFLWPQLPSIVPIHFGSDGKANGFGNKNEIWVGLSILTVIGWGCFMLIVNIHKIDPKKSTHNPKLMKKIGLATLVLIVLIECMIVNSASSGATNLVRWILPVIGLFFAFLGSTFTTLQPNYFVGIRTPWAIENKENWTSTHKLAAKLFIAGGLLAIPLSLFMPIQIAAFSFITITLLICIIPVLYSYREYKKTNNQIS